MTEKRKTLRSLKTFRSLYGIGLILSLVVASTFAIAYTVPSSEASQLTATAVDSRISTTTSNGRTVIGPAITYNSTTPVVTSLSTRVTGVVSSIDGGPTTTWVNAVYSSSGETVYMDNGGRIGPQPTPKPHAPTVETPTKQVFEDREYIELAKAAGWNGAKSMTDKQNKTAIEQRKRAEFTGWLNQHSVEVYDVDKVERYLQGEVNKLNADAADKKSITRYSYEWFPLEGKEVRGLGTYTVSGYKEGNTQTVQYEKPIPARVLRLMAELRDCYPDAKFSVSDVTDFKDPFLKVRFDWGESIIAKWDEPSYK